MFLYMPIDKITTDPIYKATADQLEWRKQIDYNKSTELLSVIELSDICQAIFPKLYTDKIRMQYLTAWIEVDKSVLDMKVPAHFPGITTIIEDGSEFSKNILFKDYVMGYKQHGEKALLFISHKDNMNSRNFPTSSEELYCFVDQFSNQDLSNVFTQDSSIAAKKAEYQAPILTDKEIEAMLKSEMIDFINEWNLNINTVQLKDDIEKDLKSYYRK